MKKTQYDSDMTNFVQEHIRKYPDEWVEITSKGLTNGVQIAMPICGDAYHLFADTDTEYREEVFVSAISMCMNTMFRCGGRVFMHLPDRKYWMTTTLPDQYVYDVARKALEYAVASTDAIFKSKD